MSTSKDSAHLTIEHGSSTLEIEVVDSNFEPVAAGVAKLAISVEPGLYEIRFREGSAQETRLLKADAGANLVQAPQFQPASAAPVDQTSTTHEYHQEPVIQATGAIGRECAAPGPETGGLVLMVRNVRGQDDLPFLAGLPGRLSVVDRNLALLDQTGERWQSDAQGGWALWSKAVAAPGGYALRIETGEPGSEVLYQSLWVDEGWQTMVFVPNIRDGPAPELATVHIARVGQWTPWDEGSTIAIALESVLAGLRSGRSVVPSDLEQLLEAKFVNPLLGISAAHALLLDSQPSLKLLKTVVENLEPLLPTNPDVIALGHRARAAGANVAAKEGVVWPPMMYIGYRSLLRADASEPGVIVDGSTAEDVAARMRVSGLWTTWAELLSAPAATARGIEGAMGEVGEQADPATERLRAYIEGAVEVGGVTSEDILERSPTELALATGLPSGAVRGAVESLTVDLA